MYMAECPYEHKCIWTFSSLMFLAYCSSNPANACLDNCPQTMQDCNNNTVPSVPVPESLTVSCVLDPLTDCKEYSDNSTWVNAVNYINYIYATLAYVFLQTFQDMSCEKGIRCVNKVNLCNLRPIPARVEALCSQYREASSVYHNVIIPAADGTMCKGSDPQKMSASIWFNEWFKISLTNWLT